MLRMKSVYSPIEREKDGLRILATRFHGRGLRKFRRDVWMPSLGPSERLFYQVQQDRISGPEFWRRYKKELFEGGSIDRKSKLIKNYGQKFTCV